MYYDNKVYKIIINKYDNILIRKIVRKKLIEKFL